MSFEGKKNAYYCEDCKGYIVTIDRDEGVTPMFLACRTGRSCKGSMRSMMYPDEPWPAVDGFGNPIPTEPTWEWYRPDSNKVRKMSRDMKEHIAKGGLDLGRIK
jgi:hypothetical protein